MVISGPQGEILMSSMVKVRIDDAFYAYMKRLYHIRLTGTLPGSTKLQRLPTLGNRLAAYMAKTLGYGSYDYKYLRRSTNQQGGKQA